MSSPPPDPLSHGRRGTLLVAPITGEPDIVGLARSTPGPRGHRRQRIGGPHSGFVGSGLVITGSSTITTPAGVTPNSHCRVLARLRATRSGPMIGSRTTIVPT